MKPNRDDGGNDENSAYHDMLMAAFGIAHGRLAEAETLVEHVGRNCRAARTPPLHGDFGHARLPMMAGGSARANSGPTAKTM
jgi:hypothetical protein